MGEYGLSRGAPPIRSVGPLAFGPDGVLFVADNASASVFAIDVADDAPAAASALPRVPIVDFSAFGAVEVRPLSRIQRISGARLQASWVNLPHVTQHEDADITDMEAVRVALKSLRANKLRSLLAMLGIIIGVWSVISALALLRSAYSLAMSMLRFVPVRIV